MSTLSSEILISKTKLESISARSQRDPKAVFTSVIHLLNKPLLWKCFKDLPKDKALGIDGISKFEYGIRLDQNLDDLLLRIRKRTYVPKSAKIVNTPKSDGTTRPLAICCFEDKIVQEAVRNIVEAIYEPLFTNVSHGFRPNRGCDTALKDLNEHLIKSSCGAYIDIDLKSFFNSISHEKLLKLLELKIKQPDLIKLLTKIIKTSNIDDEGNSVSNSIGVPQGSILSPLLANIFLHYALDVWFMRLKAENIFGVINMVRYADDVIFSFENTTQAECFMLTLQERLKRFDIELNLNKTKMSPCGAREAAYCAKHKATPPSFTFLGFVHYWKKSLNRGTGQTFWRPAVKSCPARIRKKLKEMEAYIKKNRHHPDIIKLTSRVVKGIAGYFCVNDNSGSVYNFNFRVTKILFKWINRRSQRKNLNWTDFMLLIKSKGYPTKFEIKNLFYPGKSYQRY